LRIRIPDPDPGFDDLKLKKFTAGNLIFIFLIKNCNSIKDAQATGEAVQPSKENIQHFKTILFFFLFLWVIFALLDPDPQFECGSGSSNSN
jgi:hypothetical protein